MLKSNKYLDKIKNQCLKVKKTLDKIMTFSYKAKQKRQKRDEINEIKNIGFETKI